MKVRDFIDDSYVLDVKGRTVRIVDEDGNRVELLHISDDEYMGDLTANLLDSLIDTAYELGREKGQF
jgi:hypothetical protein